MKRTVTGHLVVTTWLAAAGIAALAAARPAVPPSGGAGEDGSEEAPAADLEPLLRDGSFLIQVKGTLHRGQREDRWLFRAPSPEPGQDPYELTLLPCRLLEGLERIVESMPDRAVVFDLTGQVFAYHDRNYLLPTHAAQLVDFAIPPESPAPGPADRGGDADEPEAILRELERDVGPVWRARRPDVPAAARPAPRGAPGSVMLRRRGWMARTEDGGWSFVFAADHAGLADPPVRLLPCLLLEEMELQAQRRGAGAPLLLSGRAYRYHDRTWLLPTAFTIPRNQTPLQP